MKCEICKKEFDEPNISSVSEGDLVTISYPDRGRAKVALKIAQRLTTAPLVRTGCSIFGVPMTKEGTQCVYCGSPFLLKDGEYEPNEIRWARMRREGKIRD